MQFTISLGRYGIYSVVLLLALFMAINTQAVEPKELSAQPSKGRAVSLKVLEERVKVCMNTGECPEKIFEFCGLKKVIGFVIDDKNRDIILVGEVNTTSPPLHLEDFVVALRNAWLKYAVLQGNTYYYSAPGCSIDPNPTTIQRLQRLAHRVLSEQAEIEKAFQKWDTICSEQQTVRVLGIPFDSHFARVTVEADYYMKRLVDGSVFLGIEGFESLTDITLEKVKEAVVQNQPISIPISCLDRFWFFPGENRYLEDKGVVYIKKCQVKLLTEEEFLTGTGKVAGTGRANSLAQNFSENFTAKYEQISQRKPIYTELESLFRFVALAKVMKHKETPSEVGLSLNYFLTQYPLKRTLVDRTLPGLSHVKGFDHRRDFNGGYEVAQVRLPSCGGVSIDIRVSKDNILKDETGRLRKLREAVLKARSSPDDLYWDFPAIRI